MSQKKSFKPTPIPHRTKFGEPMAYYMLSDDGKIHTEISRSVCLAHTDETDNQFPQRWYVDEESGLVVRLPRNQKGEDLARDNMRFIWREQKHQERKFQCIWKGTNKCDQKSLIQTVMSLSARLQKSRARGSNISSICSLGKELNSIHFSYCIIEDW